MGLRKMFDNVQSVANTGRDVGRKLLGAGNSGRKLVGDVFNVATKIPVLGGIVDKLANTNLYGDMSAKDIADKASGGLDVANDLSQGDFGSAYRKGRKVTGLRNGGFPPEGRVPPLRGPLRRNKQPTNWESENQVMYPY